MAACSPDRASTCRLPLSWNRARSASGTPARSPSSSADSSPAEAGAGSSQTALQLPVQRRPALQQPGSVAQHLQLACRHPAGEAHPPRRVHHPAHRPRGLYPPAPVQASPIPHDQLHHARCRRPPGPAPRPASAGPGSELPRRRPVSCPPPGCPRNCGSFREADRPAIASQGARLMAASPSPAPNAARQAPACRRRGAASPRKANPAAATVDPATASGQARSEHRGAKYSPAQRARANAVRQVARQRSMRVRGTLTT